MAEDGLEVLGVIEAKRTENGKYFMVVNGREYSVSPSETIYADLIDVGKKVRVTVRNSEIILLRPQPVNRTPPAPAPTTPSAPAKSTTPVTTNQPPTTTDQPRAVTNQPSSPAPAPVKTPVAPAKITNVMEGVTPAQGKAVEIYPEILTVASNIVLRAYPGGTGKPAPEFIREVTLQTWQVAEWLTTWCKIREVR